jgi:hypothetical protein
MEIGETLSIIKEIEAKNISERYKEDVVDLEVKV